MVNGDQVLDKKYFVYSLFALINIFLHMQKRDVCVNQLRGTDRISMEVPLSKLFCLLSEKGSTRRRIRFQ